MNAQRAYNQTMSAFTQQDKGDQLIQDILQEIDRVSKAGLFAITVKDNSLEDGKMYNYVMGDLQGLGFTVRKFDDTVGYKYVVSWGCYGY